MPTSEIPALDFERHLPFLFAGGYAVAVSLFVMVSFAAPPPRFMDIYLIGIVFFAARWSRGPALFLYFLSLLFCWWILPPRGSLAISEGYDIYRMASYSACAVAVISGVEYVKERR